MVGLPYLRGFVDVGLPGPLLERRRKMHRSRSRSPRSRGWSQILLRPYKKLNGKTRPFPLVLGIRAGGGARIRSVPQVLHSPGVTTDLGNLCLGSFPFVFVGFLCFPGRVLPIPRLPGWEIA